MLFHLFFCINFSFFQLILFLFGGSERISLDQCFCILELTTQLMSPFPSERQAKVPISIKNHFSPRVLATNFQNPCQSCCKVDFDISSSWYGCIDLIFWINHKYKWCINFSEIIHKYSVNSSSSAFTLFFAQDEHWKQAYNCRIFKRNQITGIKRKVGTYEIARKHL